MRTSKFTTILRSDGPRWLVLCIDVLVVWCSALLTYYLIYKHRTDVVDLQQMSAQSVILTGFYLLAFLLFKPYKSIIRRTGLRDLIEIGKSVLLTFGLLVCLTLIGERSVVGDWLEQHVLWWPFSQTQLLFHMLITGFGMMVLRMLYKTLYHLLFWSSKQQAIPVILFGAGNMGHHAYNMLEMGSKNRYRVVAVLDDNPQRIGKRLQGLKINPLHALNIGFLDRIGGAKDLVIAIDNHTPERIRSVTEQAESLPLKIKIIPNSARLMEGQLSNQQMRSVKIEDLLGRKPIQIDNPVVFESLKDQVVLVTGGAGSIGSELVRQISKTSCKSLIVLDQAESALYDVQQELKINKRTCDIKFIVGNVRDTLFMEKVFEEEHPDWVFHAAAYKHVPLMEENPYEAVLTNVYGSGNVAKLAHKYGVQKFVMVSTDKAVNPTNVMGATKRIAEIYVSALNQSSKTAYMVTRFGNVLGSNGSVIPLFEKQIANGGPLTITHPDITRYFMTIPEACQLVQEASVMGKGGEVFVFDMGQPVRIIDLAKQMIRLKGLTYPQDMDIQIVGLRPGEKIYEELLADNENTLKTYHEKIMIAQVDTTDLETRCEQIEALCKAVQLKENDACPKGLDIVAQIKEIVPEYKSSQNSVFAELDK